MFSTKYQYNPDMRELKWWVLFVAISAILVGRMSDFRFNDIEIQLHDTYYIVPSWLTFSFVLSAFGLLRVLTGIPDRVSDKNRGMAILVSALNGALWLFLIIIICGAIFTLVQVKAWYPDLDISNYVGIIAALILLLTLLTVIEVRIIRKIRAIKKH